MAGYSTAAVLVGPLGVGPFGDRAWRVTSTVTLIEKHRRCWMVNAAGYGEPDEHAALYFPPSLNPAEELLLAVAGLVVRAPSVWDIADRYRLVHPSRTRSSKPTIDFDPAETQVPDSAYGELLSAALASVVESARLGVIRLDEMSQFDADAIYWLRSTGCDIDEFGLLAPPESGIR